MFKFIFSHGLTLDPATHSSPNVNKDLHEYYLEVSLAFIVLQQPHFIDGKN